MAHSPRISNNNSYPVPQLPASYASNSSLPMVGTFHNYLDLVIERTLEEADRTVSSSSLENMNFSELITSIGTSQVLNNIIAIVIR